MSKLNTLVCHEDGSNRFPRNIDIYIYTLKYAASHSRSQKYLSVIYTRHESILLINNISGRRDVSRQRLGKHVPAATETHGIIEVLLEKVSSTRSVQRSYKEDN
jgi:hypothetical protein